MDRFEKYLEEGRLQDLIIGWAWRDSEGIAEGISVSSLCARLDGSAFHLENSGKAFGWVWDKVQITQQFQTY